MGYDSPLSQLDVGILGGIGTFLGFYSARSFLRVSNYFRAWWLDCGIQDLGPCMGALTILGDFMQEEKEEEVELEISGESFPSFSSWKLQRAVRLAQSRHDDSCGADSGGGGEAISQPASIERVASHFGVPLDDLVAMFEIPGGLNFGPRHLDSLLQVVVSFSRVPTSAQAPAFIIDKSMDLLPPTPDIPQTSQFRPYVAPRVFPDGRVSIPLSEVVTNKNKLRHLRPFLEALELDMERARVFSESQRHSRASLAARRPFVIEASDCIPMVRGLPLNISAAGMCTPRDDSDIDQGRFPVELIQSILGPRFTDQELFSFCRFGMDLRSSAPWAIVLCPPMQSARPFMQRLTESADKEIKKGWLRVEEGLVSCAPMSCNSFGMIAKHDKPPFPKLRETSNLSSPEEMRDSEGSLLAVNANIDLEKDFASIHLPTTAHFREAAAIFHSSLMLRILPTCPSLESDLEVVTTKADAVAWFRQYPVRIKNQCRQMRFDKPKNGPMRVLSSSRLQFGGRPSPHLTQRMTVAVDFEVSKLKDEWNCRLVEIVTRGRGPGLQLALRLAPPELVQWLHDRRQLLGSAEAVCGFNKGFIDDEMSLDMGRIRAIVGLVFYFDVMKAFELPVSLPKCYLGDGLPLLGIEFYNRAAFTRPSEDKLDMLDDWLGRVVRLPQIEREELISLAHTLNFCAFSIPHGRLLLRPVHRAAHQRLAIWKAPRKHDRLFLPLTAATCLRRIHASLRESGGLASFYQPSQWEEGASIQCEGWTDANRASSDVDWSGMGGFCPQTCVVWFYQFDAKQRRLLPIHIMEDLATVVQLSLNARGLAGRRYLAWEDNEAVVASIRGNQGVSDGRMNKIALLRNHIRDSYDIAEKCSRVESKQNIADPVSRGDFKRFIEEAHERGFREFVWVDARKEGVPIDLDILIQHLCPPHT